MRNNGTSWLFQPYFDFEYKSYQILAFQQTVEKHLTEYKLFPYISQITSLLKKIQDFEQDKASLENELSSDLKSLDLSNMLLVREGIEDHEKIDELNKIMKFARKRIASLANGAFELKNQLESEIQISPIGLIDESMTGGYLFFKKPEHTAVYSYEYRLIKSAHSSYKDVRTTFINAEQTSFATNFSDIKIKYIKTKQARYGLNAYLVETNIHMPHFETILPLVKDYLMKLEAH